MPTTRSIFSPPATHAQLRDFLRHHLDIIATETPLIPGHSTPFDYLAHSYFEGWSDPDSGHASAPPDGDRTRDCVVWANRGGGKTFLGAVATLLDMLFKPGIEIRILGGSLDQSARMFRHLSRLIARPDIAPFVLGKPGSRRIEFTNGARVEILAQSETSVRGTRVQKIRCDEVELFDRDVWEAAQLTTRSERIPGPWGERVGGTVEALSTMHDPFGLMWSLVHPPAPEDSSDLSASPPRTRRIFRWGVLDVLNHCPPDRPCERCPLHRDCAGLAKRRAPDSAGHVPIDDAIRLMGRVSRARWESEMLCLHARRDDCVYPEFDPSAHVFGAPSDDLRAQLAAHGAHATSRLVAGMDFGFRNPTAMLIGAIDHADDTLRILWDSESSGRRLDEHADSLLDLVAPHGHAPPSLDFIAVDPAGNAVDLQTGISCAQSLRKRGYRVRTPSAPIGAGLESVRARLRPADGSTPRLLIHARCTRLITHLSRYHYDAGRPGSTDPVKDGPDHMADALRYLVVALDAQRRARQARYA